MKGQPGTTSSHHIKIRWPSATTEAISSRVKSDMNPHSKHGMPTPKPGSLPSLDGSHYGLHIGRARRVSDFLGDLGHGAVLFRWNQDLLRAPPLGTPLVPVPCDVVVVEQFVQLLGRYSECASGGLRISRSMLTSRGQVQDEPPVELGQNWLLLGRLHSGRLQGVHRLSQLLCGMLLQKPERSAQIYYKA